MAARIYSARVSLSSDAQLPAASRRSFESLREIASTAFFLDIYRRYSGRVSASRARAAINDHQRNSRGGGAGVLAGERLGEGEPQGARERNRRGRWVLDAEYGADDGDAGGARGAPPAARSPPP